MKRLAFLFSALLAAAAVSAANVSVTLTVTPTSSNAPIAPTLTWTSTGAGACTASDGWSGAKPVNGTELAAAVSKTTKYTLTCTSPTGPATLTWSAPLTFSDGTPITGITGYQVMMGGDITNLARAVLLPPTPPNAVVQVPAGKTFFTLRTEATLAGLSVESPDGMSASKTVVADTAVGSVTLTVAVVPNPPTNLTVQ